MSEKIKPALSEEEWRDPSRVLEGGYLNVNDTSIVIDGEVLVRQSDRGTPALIALLNDVLPDSDRRKITREKIASLRRALDGMENDHGWDCADLDEFAVALESYLRPG